MKIAIVLVLVFAATLVSVVFIQAESYSQSKLPKDEPNFKPEITKEIIDGRVVEIIEFKSRLAT